MKQIMNTHVNVFQGQAKIALFSVTGQVFENLITLNLVNIAVFVIDKQIA